MSKLQADYMDRASPPYQAAIDVVITWKISAK